MTVSEIRNILENPYDRKVWKSFLKSQFTNNKLNVEDRVIALSDNTFSKQCLSLGNYEINEYTRIGIFEVELSEKVNITRNRVALRNLIKDLTKQVAGSMVVFVQGDKWRFSYISKRKVKNKETNEIQDKETATKRYTYLFGKNEKALTAAIRFERLIQKQKENIFQLLSLDDFEDAFSVEKLSKEFFKNYKDTYENFVQLLTGKRYSKKSNKYVEQIIHEPDWQLTALFSKDEKQARDFCKRLMGRIVFLYFIQKKGWLAVGQGKKWGEGNPNYLYDLFQNSKHKNDFYARELVPLFFTRLNNEDSENAARVERFPYLNGGLFDAAQDSKYNKLYFPENIFEGLFETFNNYNFTIYEDAPDEHTIAVDPEMLGHIFENLLEDNKAKGAFYTPKEIVHYMSKESLKTYLFAHDEQHFAENKLARCTIGKIIQQQELDNEEKLYAEKNAYKIINTLEQVKICDPAIGSGAFLIGLLQEIFNAQIYLQELKGFKKSVSDADIKKHIIEESIYGVDIDAGAVDIARLRFWLSLVVDEQEPQPLPNLDFKIICANTLIPLGDLKDYDIEGKAAQAVKELEALRHDFFNVSSENKLQLERKFKKIQTDLLSLRELSTSRNYEIYTKLYEFNPFEENESCSWFDSWWMFGIKEGFDIVIGNPPYVQLQKDGGKLAKLYEPYKYDTFERTGDIYSLFYERGVQLLNDKGILCFISSNKWMRANYGASTRHYFAEKTYPLLLIDFGNVQVFDTATVDTNILILQKKPKQRIYEPKKLIATRINNDFNLAEQSLSDYVSSNNYTVPSLSHNAWVIGEKDVFSIKEHVERQGIPLNKWKIIINYGIKTGLNEAFIINNEIKEKIIADDPHSIEILRPILRGRDFVSWYPDFDNLWLVNTHNGVKSLNIPRVDALKNYPAVYNWLSNFKNQLQSRNDSGDDWTNLRNCAYIMDFDKPKIMYPNMTKYMPFIYDESNHFYSNDKSYILTGENLKYLTCFLNSKLFKYCFSDNFPELQGGTRELRKVFFEKIPVKQITGNQEIPFAKIVDYLVALKKENPQDSTDQFILIYFEQIANALVFELYFKEEFEDRNLQFAKYIADLPKLSELEKPLHQLRKIYVIISANHHPVRQSLFSMQAIPQIELILNNVQL
ncbi:Eco57I restriction-modification methylase domain-containing protein [Larkinella humicola]|uniref:site-specific DNA-methyltransferase (adenine-specific) n=1 Tax=Larkinella humicola TaxID=2607654 RepID=A0A5N1JG07_9BACT|nr:Eco57I restriction-modification methylase domain-containing protein [Larkinella humicola]KAA9349570.1 DNA modification methylase [Larkinella humicola]